MCAAGTWGDARVYSTSWLSFIIGALTTAVLAMAPSAISSGGPTIKWPRFRASNTVDVIGIGVTLTGAAGLPIAAVAKIGRASCRERETIWVGGGAVSGMVKGRHAGRVQT